MQTQINPGLFDAVKEKYHDIYEAIRQDIRERGDDCATEDEVNREADADLLDMINFIRNFSK